MVNFNTKEVCDGEGMNGETIGKNMDKSWTTFDVGERTVVFRRGWRVGILKKFWDVGGRNLSGAATPSTPSF